MLDPFVGQITIYGYNWAPKGWALCNGASLPVAQNQVLFALIGTNYGGNTVNFNLPDLRGRTMVGYGLAATGTRYSLGASGGSDTFAVPAAALPYHNHTMVAMNTAPTQLSPANGMFAMMPSNGTPPISGLYTTTASTTDHPAASVVGTTGAGAPVDNRQPALAINFCIATLGIWPQRP